MTRGDIADRFDKIKDTYLDVQKDTKVQIEKEHLILEAYMDFRGAMKQSEVLALEVLKTAEGKLEDAKARMTAASAAVTALRGRRIRRSVRSWSWRATRSCAACRRKRSATRSPRTSRTT